MIALLVLAALGWSQAVTLACPMQVPDAASAVVAHEGAHDAGPDTGHSAPSHSEGSGDCRMILTCGAAVLVVALADVLPTAAGPGAAPRFEPHPIATTIPDQDVPPPRSSV